MDNVACLTLARVFTGVCIRGKHARHQDTRWNQLRRACHTVPTRILLFARAPMRFCCTAKARLHVTSDNRHKRDYDIEHKPTTENGDAREGRLGGEEIGTRLVPLSSCISSFCDRRNTHRDKREKRTGSSLMSLKHIPCKFCLSNSCGSNGIKALRNAPKLPLRPCPGVHNTLEELFEKWSLTLKTLHVSRPQYAEGIRKHNNNRSVWICGGGKHIIVVVFKKLLHSH